jgi:hypothetical protein
MSPIATPGKAARMIWISVTSSVAACAMVYPQFGTAPDAMLFANGSSRAMNEIAAPASTSLVMWSRSMAPTSAPEQLLARNPPDSIATAMWAWLSVVTMGGRLLVSGAMSLR